jgi:BMFP domain-containing protein YqiC
VSLDEILKLASTGLGFINFLVTVGLWLYVRSSDRHEKIDARFSELERNVDGRLDGTQQRLAALEAEVKRAPTHDDLSRIYERINQVATSVSEIKGGMDEVKVSFRQLMSNIITKGTQ